MRKNEKDKVNRMAFIKMIIDNPENAEEYLKKQIKIFRQCKGTQDTVESLSKLLFLSEQTIYKDYAR